MFTELVTTLPTAIPIVLPPDTKPVKEELDTAVHPSQMYKEQELARQEHQASPSSQAVPAGSHFVNPTRSELTERVNKLMFETLALSQSKEVMKTAYEAQLKPLQDQISILMNHNKAAKNDFHTSRNTANTCQNLEETEQRFVSEKKALTTEVERLMWMLLIFVNGKRRSRQWKLSTSLLSRNPES